MSELDDIRKRHNYDESCEKLLAPYRSLWERIRSAWARQTHKDRATLLAKVGELEARRLYLPKITIEIIDTLDGSGLIDNGQWSQEAVEFVCILQTTLEQEQL